MGLNLVPIEEGAGLNTPAILVRMQLWYVLCCVVLFARGNHIDLIYHQAIVCLLVYELSRT